jgi:hypothetical protein
MTGAAPALLAVALLFVLPGCARKPRFVPVKPDSSLVAAGDSLAEQVRVLQRRWAAPGAGEEAARLTAELLLGDLRMRLAREPRLSWEQRARTLLDSLDVGAEFASDGCALFVNLFSRSDPSAGSWPWVYWCAGDTIRGQQVEGEGMSVVALASRGLDGEPPGPPGAPGIAALFARRGPGGQQPLMLVWRVDERLDLAQTLGPDSLGGVGTGTFGNEADTLVTLTTRTWRPTARFDECATCPHVYRTRRFEWAPGGFHRVEESVIPSPYVTFVRLIHALAAGDHSGALRYLTRPGLVESAYRAGWGMAGDAWRAAPGSQAAGSEMVFYRGASEAWRVRFHRVGGEWLVDGFEPTTRIIE